MKPNLHPEPVLIPPDAFTASIKSLLGPPRRLEGSDGGLYRRLTTLLGDTRLLDGVFDAHTGNGEAALDSASFARGGNLEGRAHLANTGNQHAKGESLKARVEGSAAKAKGSAE